MLDNQKLLTFFYVENARRKQDTAYYLLHMLCLDGQGTHMLGLLHIMQEPTQSLTLDSNTYCGDHMPIYQKFTSSQTKTNGNLFNAMSCSCVVSKPAYLSPSFPPCLTWDCIFSCGLTFSSRQWTCQVRSKRGKGVFCKDEKRK